MVARARFFARPISPTDPAAGHGPYPRIYFRRLKTIGEIAETKPTRCAEARKRPTLLKSRSVANRESSFLVAFTQQVRARPPPRPSRARRECRFRRARAWVSSRHVSGPRATVTACARHRSGVLAKHRKRDALTRRIRPSLPSIDRTKPYTMPKKRRANGRNKPAGARGHVSALPSSPARETARATVETRR